ncbi:calcium-dependent protein kinase 27 isoform X2 [Ooceraea biroi]|uniref:calcium-dependent protein kinase 27 isoform X2 n=1 Tax=Ooceraea biroi TaxID=2015173 RepID=UPI000F08687E|nr:calcium-dependent protein kinase 27 isoform X2 [Ooceraea biroi]
MVNTGSLLAHFVKLLVTTICISHLAEPCRAKASSTAWSLRAFLILLMHSILGIFRFGFSFTSSSTPTAKFFRSFYDWFSNVIEIVPLALLTSGILSAYHIDETIRMLLLFLGTVPVFFPLAIKQKESQIRKFRFLTNIAVVLQILAITILGLQNGNYNEEDDQKVAVMRKAFQMFDTTKSGFIETMKISTILNTMGQLFDDGELNTLIEEHDPEGAGKVNFDGFCKIAGRFLEEEDAEAMQEELKEAFRLYDREGNGYITTATLKEILAALDDKLTSSDLDGIIAEIDTDGSGTVDFDEFMEMMTGE